MEQQPLLAQQQVDPTADKVSVRFCVHQNPCCLNKCIPCCCKGKYLDEIQIVVPETTTVGEFLQIASDVNKPKDPYTSAFINGYQLTHDDLIAPTIRSFENFASPIVVSPKEPCCLLI